MTEPVRPEDMRVSDIERGRFRDRLRRAHDVAAGAQPDQPPYPWWIWVAGPPGAVLAVLFAAGIGRLPRDGS